MKMKVPRPLMRRLNALAVFRPDVYKRVVIRARQKAEADTYDNGNPILKLHWGNTNGFRPDAEAADAIRQLSHLSAIRECAYETWAVIEILQEESFL